MTADFYGETDGGLFTAGSPMGTVSRYGKPCQTHFEAVAHVVETPEGPAAWLPWWLGVGVGLGGWLVRANQGP